MSNARNHLEAAENAEDVARAAWALKQGIAEVRTPAQAAKTLDALEEAAGDLSEEDVAKSKTGFPPENQATAIEKAGDVPPEDKPACVIAAAAVQSASAPQEGKPIVDNAVALALGGQGERALLPGAEHRGRSLLREELFRRLRPFDAIDAIAFLEINQLPHTRQTDRFLSRLSWVMTGGAGWYVVLLLAILADRRRGWNSVRAVVPALWLATATVEYPIKALFRRRRPFISLVRAIIVGRKPGSYSFPSGHSAAAFAGALLLARRYPCQARVFFALASLVGFSRVYLGAHYPGDVLTGSVAGMALARAYSHLLRRAGVAPDSSGATG